MFAVRAGKVILKHIPKKYLGDNVLKILYDIIEEKVFSLEEDEASRYRKFINNKEDSLSRLSDNQTAFIHATRMCNMMQQELDIKYPENVVK